MMGYTLPFGCTRILPGLGFGMLRSTLAFLTLAVVSKSKTARGNSAHATCLLPRHGPRSEDGKELGLGLQTSKRRAVNMHYHVRAFCQQDADAVDASQAQAV